MERFINNNNRVIRTATKMTETSHSPPTQCISLCSQIDHRDARGKVHGSFVLQYVYRSVITHIFINIRQHFCNMGLAIWICVVKPSQIPHSPFIKSLFD